jgi:hypothetical protein
MSNELVAALVGAVAGGILTLFGAIAQAFIQGWIRERGKITYDVVDWYLHFNFQGSDPHSRPRIFVGQNLLWEEARAYAAEPDSIDSIAQSIDSLAELRSAAEKSGVEYKIRGVGIRGDYSFTVNFLNTKGINAALLEYSVQFLRGNQTIATSRAFVVKIGTEGGVYPGQAVSLPAEAVTGLHMRGGIDTTEESKKVLREADSVVFTARLSSGPPIKVELERPSQDAKGAPKADAA